MTCEEARDHIIVAATGPASWEVRRALAGHLEGCPECRREAARIEGVVTLLRQEPEPRPPEAFWADFMTSLSARLAAERRLASPVRRWLGERVRPGRAVAMLATAALLAIALRSPQEMSLRPVVPPGPEHMVTDSIRQMLPAMLETAEVWRMGLGAVEREALLMDREDL